MPPVTDYTLALDELPDPLPIEPLAQPFDVTITPPGSKSITNRAYVLAALADGESRIIRPLRSEDTDGLLDALCTLGAKAQWDGDDVRITGVNGRFPRGGSVNLGDGGTPTRFMIAAACLAAEPVVVDGSPRMRERPIAEGVDMLRQLGATIEYMEEEGRLPVRVVPSKNFKGGELTVGKTASSQFISAVMLIAPWLERGVDLKIDAAPTSEAYLDLTRAILSQWNLLSDEDLLQDDIDELWKPGNRISISPYDDVFHDCPSASTHQIEPDASSAVYWLGAAALVCGSRATIQYFDRCSPQPDQSIIGMIQSSGANVQTRGPVTCDDSWEQEIVKRSRTVVNGIGIWRAQDFHGEDCPDGSMLLAVMAAVADGTSTITGLHTLRIKETDRIAALANELRKVGCTVETTDDSIAVTPPAEPGANSGVVIETYNDHRMAMSFAILGLVRPGISIANPKCVAKSYPTFWRDFARLYANPVSEQ
jgi:3-phosphoshikimate 1-carboxyvinyltransferase